MGSSDLESALKEAATGKSDSPTGTEGKVEETPTPSTTAKTAEPEAEKAEGKKSEAVPYSRFKEVVDAKNTTTEQLSAAQKTLEERDTEVKKLIDALETREYDSKVIQKINELHDDDRYREMIETLDKAIRGQHVEEPETPEEGDEKDKEKAQVDRTAKALEDTKSDLQKQLSNQRDEIILDRYDRLVEKYMGELPETYNEEDRKVIKETLVDRMEWPKVEADPNALGDVLHAGFQKTISWYGTPKGSLVAPKPADETTEDTPQTPKEQLEALQKVETGGLKDTGRTIKMPDGREVAVKEPEVSENDFVDQMAKALRIAREIP